MKGRKSRGLVGATGLTLLTLMAAAAVVGLWPGAASAEEATGSAEVRPGYPEPVLGSLKKALGIYEEVRVELVADRLERVPARALRLAGALRQTLTHEGRNELAANVPAVIEEAAHNAESLGEAEDLAAARVTFGEVSRGFMRLAGHDSRLAEGWHVFACPMVASFAKWIQPTEALENPYMGPAMPKCGFATDWSLPAPPAVEATVAAAEEEAPEAGAPARAEPEFKPGIPGLKMVDVRDHKFLWREIDELQAWERGERITVAEYRSKAIEKTAHFLELEGAVADDFIAASAAAVDSVRKSFFERQANGETSGVEGGFSSELRAATLRLTSLLQEEPRHLLFAPGCKKWLLKLAFGPSEAKEKQEKRAG